MRKSSMYITFFMLLALQGQATQEVRYKEGEAIGGATKVDINPGQLSNIPNYIGDRPSEAGFYEDSEKLSGSANAKSHESPENEAGGLLIEAQSKRKHFEINPNTDPLFIQANSIIAKPEEALKVRVDEGEAQRPTQEIHKCYESRDIETHKCTMQRFVKLKDIEEKKHVVAIKSYRHGPYGGPLRINVLTGTRHDPAASYRGPDYAAGIHIDGNPFPMDQKERVISSRVTGGPFRMEGGHLVCDARSHWYHAHGSVEVIYKPKPTEADLIETIEDSCVGLESATETGVCRYGTETILEGEATRNLDGLEVKRDWWHKERTYICNYPSKNDCEPLRAKGCFQTNSKCHVEKEGRCLEFEQTYTCVKYPSSSNKATSKGAAPFCLTGDCTNQSWNPNQDMAEVMAKLSMLKELKNEMDVTKAGKIFHGTAMSCSKHCISFSDCCGLSSGWGEDLGLTRCSEGEKLLSKKRQEHKCHQVGTYCAKKVPLIGCILKKTTFCCFASRLARTIHEQGRAQLGIGWGAPEGPDCRPFTIEEFSRIDFKRINFSEIFSEVWSKIKVPDAGKVLNQFQQDWSKRLPTSSELNASKLSELSQMRNKVSERRTQAASSLSAGAYSLNGNPPVRTAREEEQAEVVF